jgi:hypothetical protein
MKKLYKKLRGSWWVDIKSMDKRFSKLKKHIQTDYMCLGCNIAHRISFNTVATLPSSQPVWRPSFHLCVRLLWLYPSELRDRTHGLSLYNNHQQC